ncbi:MAG: hexokinase [Bacteroidales bacterium]|nr:hexokinase [Bacteroidales bacterium]MDD3200519.1 hexokinase [Bacteroidales bacterium]
MTENIFALSCEQLKEIANELQRRIDEGLSNDDSNNELACLPTFIQPKSDKVEGTATVLDLGGTNYRVAKVTILNGKTEVHPNNQGIKQNLEKIKEPGYTEEKLLRAMADPIISLVREKEMPIGYCFSYPADSLQNGDAKLKYWTKGVNIPEMEGKPVGEHLLNYLNKNTTPKFTGIKVINDTVASLFAGMAIPGYDAYIGLIVGTGTNMAAMIPASAIGKIKGMKGVDFSSDIPVNFESGNFRPPYLTKIDEFVDFNSGSRGRQRFEKAVSGMYLGEVMQSSFPLNKFDKNFNAKDLTDMMNYPDIHEEQYVTVACQIYRRSALLVAASLAGLIVKLSSLDRKPVRKVLVTADGSLFWSKYDFGKDYHEIVMDGINALLGDFGMPKTQVVFNQAQNVNLIGSAIAALSK